MHYMTNEIFPLLKFKDGEEQQFEEYMTSRGIFLYKQVYDTLCKWEENVQEIKYEHFKNVIRYDKSLRDKLYIYLAAAEEHLRNIVFENVELKKNCKWAIKDPEKKKNVNKLQKREEIEPSLESRLYYEGIIEFGDLKKIFKRFELADGYNFSYDDLEKVNKLRNKVMHHNMLLLSKFTDRKNIEKEIIKVENAIEALYRILPTDGLKEGTVIDGRVNGGLTQDINKSNYKDGDIAGEKYDNLICLHAFKEGGFLR